MLDFTIGVITTIISTLLIGLWGIFIVNPYKIHLTIYKKILRFIRNFEDPHSFEGQFVPNALLADCIKRQIEELEEIFDLVEEQKDLNKFWYRLFDFEDVLGYLNIIFEYLRNPIMLDDQKVFKDDCILDCKFFFKKLKKKVKIPNYKLIMLLIVISILIIAMLVGVVLLIIENK